MKVNNNLNFKGLYYTKAWDSSYVLSKEINKLKNVCIDKNPSQKLKNIVENSKSIKTLAEETDVFVFHNNATVENNKVMPSLSLYFKDPYECENVVTELNITNIENNENGAWAFLRNALEKLEDYYSLKQKLNFPTKNEDRAVSFIKQNDKSIGFAFISRK